MKENSDSTIGRGGGGMKAAVQSMECFDILY